MTEQREWHIVSSQGEKTSADISSHFKIFAPPKTDIWRPSPAEDRFNAPYIYTPLKSSEFRELAVTISAAWKTQFDQGGLLLLWLAEEQNQSKWIKAGIEYFNGKPMLGVVGNDRYSDWSLSVLPIAGAIHAKIEAERVESTLWIYLVFNGEKRPLREIKWAFLEDREAQAELWAGVYAAKPTPESEDDLETGIEVVFRDLQLNTTDQS